MNAKYVLEFKGSTTNLYPQFLGMFETEQTLF